MDCMTGQSITILIVCSVTCLIVGVLVGLYFGTRPL